MPDCITAIFKNQITPVYFAAGMKFNKASLMQVAHVVADVDLDPHIVDVVR